MKNLKKIALVLVIATFVPAAAYFCYRYFLIKNFAVVEGGALYRAAQMDPQQLMDVVKRHGIQTVVNLRGEFRPRRAFLAEKQALEEAQIQYYVIPMRAYRYPYRRDLMTLHQIFEKAPRPILIHCLGGADRSGLAAAIYRMDYMGQSKAKAQKRAQRIGYGSVSWRYPSQQHFIKNVYRGKRWFLKNYFPCEMTGEVYFDSTVYCEGKRPLHLTGPEHHPPSGSE